jgi:hypothetical membrane protein
MHALREVGGWCIRPMNEASGVPSVGCEVAATATRDSRQDAVHTTNISRDIAATPDRPPATIRIGALAGIVGPALFTLAFLTQETFRRGEYSPVAEPVSALEAGPNGWAQQVNFVVFGLLVLTFAIGLHRGIAPTQFGILGPALLGVASVGLFLAAAFPLREDAAGVTYDPGGHVVAGITFFLSTSLALLVLPARLAKDLRWRGLAPYTAVCAVLAVVGFVVMGRFAIPDDAPLHEYAGLCQRLVILLVTFPCLVTLAIRLRGKGSA